MASLILGPFLILALFGLGYQGVRAPVHALLVIPSESGLPTDPASYAGVADGLIVDSVGTDRETAEAKLRAREVDAVIVVPPDVQAKFKAGQRSTIEVEVNMVDPAQVNFANVMAAQLADRVNQKIVATAVQAGQARPVPRTCLPTSSPRRQRRSSSTSRRPARAWSTSSRRPSWHSCSSTCVSRSWRCHSPGKDQRHPRALAGGPDERLGDRGGQDPSYGVVAAVIAGASLVFILTALHQPFLGPPTSVFLVIGMLMLSAIGVGLLVAVFSDSERMAVQASLLLLLASIFFSGFVINLDLFSAPVQALSQLIPVTHAIASCRT